MRAGVIGMQTDGLATLQDFNKTGTILEGGGYQYEAVEFLGGKWRTYLDRIEEIQITLK